MSSSCSDSHSQSPFDLFPPLENDNQTTTSPPPPPPSLEEQKLSPSQSSPLNCNAAVFNISWGGSEDKPPAELCSPDQEVPALTRRPPPKPRGIRRLPEPEPAEDGSIDENTLKRRKNTYAARRSRMKKFLKIETLENRVNQLQTENAKLVLQNALLESEKRSWLVQEAEFKKRIKHLEDELAAHHHHQP